MNDISAVVGEGGSHVYGLVGIKEQSSIKNSYSAGQVIFDDSIGNIKENIGDLLGNDVFKDIESKTSIVATGDILAPNPKTNENTMPYALILIGIASIVTLSIFKSKKIA